MHAWNTPQRLRASVIAIWIGAVIYFLLVMVTVNQLHGAIRTVGSDAAPSIIAAQKMRAFLSDMDSNLANELIGKPGQNMDAVKAYAVRRDAVADNLVSAAQNITYGDAERGPVLKIAQGMMQYSELAAQARSFHERGDAAMLAAYREATGVLHGMTDQAIQLDKVNNDHLEQEYSLSRTISYVLLGLTLVCGVGLLGMLFVVQTFLLRRMKRVINPALAGATGLGVLFVLLTLGQLLHAASSLKIAKEDAFDSVRTLWQARAVAFDANGDESRWLLDRPFAAKYEQSFFASSNRLLKLEPGQHVDFVATAKQQGSGGSEVPYLAKEINNITFPGEQEAAEAMIKEYGEYFLIDARIRTLENSGDQARAVAVCIGNDPGESNYAFDRFDQATEKTIDINQKEFDRSITEGLRAVDRIGTVNPLIALAIIGLAFAGIRPRLQEYA
jgi:hypothetical protein